MNALEKYAAKSALKKALGKGLETAVRRGTPHRAPASILAHELGHAKTLRGSSKTVRKLRMYAYGGGSVVGQVANQLQRAKLDPWKFSSLTRSQQKQVMNKAMLRHGGTQAVAEAPKLAEEFLATYHGLKALKKFKGIAPGMYRKARKDLLWAYTTYLSGATSTVTGQALAARAALKGKDVRVPIIGSMLAGTGVNLGAIGMLSKGMKDTPSLGYFGRRRLHKMMGGKDLINLQPKRGKRSPLGGFFMPDTSANKLPAEMEKAWRKRYGNKAIDRMKREGAISVPMGTRGELGGKKGIQDKLLEIARNMQKG